jgi:hypothetical protein
MTTIVEDPRLAGYLVAVRQELEDLGPDEVEELTGGLAADLADSLADSEDSPEARFGPPEQYAAELRSAAGLPRMPLPSRAGRLHKRVARLREWAGESWWWPEVREFLVSIRPLWWAFRAYIGYQLVVNQALGTERWAPQGVGPWMLLLVLLVLSIEMGRRNWAGSSLYRRVLSGLLDALTVGSILIAGFAAANGPGTPNGLLPIWSGMHDHAAIQFIDRTPTAGIINDGHRITNIFPYDADGNLLHGVQLYDNRGHPLEPVKKNYVDRRGHRIQLIPALATDGDQRYNVFPLKQRALGRPGAANPAQVREAPAPTPPAPVVPLPGSGSE